MDIKMSKAYFKLTSKRNELESKLEILNKKMQEIREKSKKLKKGSEERKELTLNIDNIKNSKEYQDLNLQIKTMNFCINTVFYS